MSCGSTPWASSPGVEVTVLLDNIYHAVINVYNRGLSALSGGLIPSLRFVGHKGQLVPRCRALDVMITKLYHGIQNAVHQFRFKNVEQHLLLGSGGGGNQNLRPSCRRPPTRTFHPPPPVGTLRLDAPALVRVCSHNDGDKLG